MVQRWDFREHEKRELEAEQKKKAGVSKLQCSRKIYMRLLFRKVKTTLLDMSIFDIISYKTLRHSK